MIRTPIAITMIPGMRETAGTIITAVSADMLTATKSAAAVAGRANANVITANAVIIAATGTDANTPAEYIVDKKADIE